MVVDLVQFGGLVFAGDERCVDIRLDDSRNQRQANAVVTERAGSSPDGGFGSRNPRVIPAKFACSDDLCDPAVS